MQTQARTGILGLATGRREGWKEGAQVTTHTGVEELCYLHVEERENCWSR